jgi:hypothetical protein
MKRINFHLIYSLLILVLALSYSKTTSSQIYFKGKIINKQTLPVAYAVIRVIDTNIVRSCNSTGDFVIQTGYSKTKVLVSAIGYFSDTFRLTQPYTSIVLRELPVMLPEAVITSTNPSKIYERCVNQLITKTSPKNNLSFMRLYSLLDNQYPFEFIETKMLSRMNNYAIMNNEFLNGRYGIIDSLLNYGAIRSIDLSNLIQPLVLQPYKSGIEQYLPFFPFFKHDYKKYINLRTSGIYEMDGKLYHKLIVQPKAKFKKGIFEAELLVNGRSGEIKHAIFKIVNPAKEVLYLFTNKYQVAMDSIQLEIALSNEGANHNYIRLMVMQLSYHLNKLTPNTIYYQVKPSDINDIALRNLSKLRTNTTNTTATEYPAINTYIQFVALQETNDDCIDTTILNLDDRKWISNILYDSSFWNGDDNLTATALESNITTQFSSNNIFVNKFESATDTAIFLDNNKYIIVKPKSLYYTDTLKPDKQKKELVLRLTYDEITYDTVGEYYFDIIAFTSYNNNKLRYMVLPVFDYHHSWRDQSAIDDLFNETLYLTMAKHTMEHAHAIQSVLASIDKRCINGKPTHKILKEHLQEYRKSRDLLLAKTYKEIVKQRIIIKMKLGD